MFGSLLSPSFKAEPPSPDDNKIASIVWGATLGIGSLTVWKAVEQTIVIWRRKRFTRSLYIWMVWLLLVVIMMSSGLCWYFMEGKIAPGFWIFFTLITMWAIQTQLLLQIIINRAALIMVNKRKAKILKLCTAVFIGLINISVYCIWIPARLQISQRFIAINAVWDRIEKVIFLFVDGGLNAYFLYLVKSQLISQGLHKYKRLFHFNSVIVLVSLAMDILLICMMDLRNSFTYIQFHPLAYMVKLYIELVMTELITKVVRTAHVPDYASSRPEPNSLRHNLSQPGSNFKIGSTAKHGDFPHTTAGNEYSAYISATNEYPSPATNPSSNAELTKFEIPDFGIQKTVSTIVTLKSQKGSETYSVEELKNYE